MKPSFTISQRAKRRQRCPRRGTTYRITRSLRGEFSADRYVGIESMLDRAWAARPVATGDKAVDGICPTRRSMLGTSRCEAG